MQRFLKMNSIIIGFFSWIFSIFLFSPRLTLFLGEGSGTTRRDDILAQCFDPFTKNLKEPILAYRIIQPSIAKALGWCGESREILALMGSPGIAYIALILTLIIVNLSLKKRFSNSLSLLATFGLATTHLTQWVNTHWGHPDSLTFLPISLLMISRQPLLIIIATSIGCINDERIILSLPFILLWWWPKNKSWNQSLKNLFPLILSSFIGIAIAFFIKISLQQGLIGPGIFEPYEVDTINGYFRVLNLSNWLGLAFMVFLGFRWLWIIPILALIILFKSRLSIRSFIFIISSLIAILLTFTVADVSRSCAFFFPMIPVAMDILKDQSTWPESKLKFWITWIIGLNVLTPALKVYGIPPDWFAVNPLEWATPALPLPINIWKWLTSPNGAITW